MSEESPATSERALLDEDAAFRFVESAPDPVRFANLDRVVEALADHRTGLADLACSQLAFVAFLLALEMRRWKENIRVRTTTCPAVAP